MGSDEIFSDGDGVHDREDAGFGKIRLLDRTEVGKKPDHPGVTLHIGLGFGSVEQRIHLAREQHVRFILAWQSLCDGKIFRDNVFKF